MGYPKDAIGESYVPGMIQKMIEIELAFQDGFHVDEELAKSVAVYYLSPRAGQLPPSDCRVFAFPASLPQIQAKAIAFFCGMPNDAIVWSHNRAGAADRGGAATSMPISQAREDDQGRNAIIILQPGS